MKSAENPFINPDNSSENGMEASPEFEVAELGIADIDSIKDLEDRSWIPDLQADRETIEKRLNLSHKIIGLRHGEQLIGKICFGYANFSPDLSPKEQNFPGTFEEFSSVSLPERYNSVFIYDLDIDPQFRSLSLIKKLIDAAKERAIANGCQYGVFDVRVPSYNGSSEYEQENRPMNESVHQTLDSYATSEDNITPVRKSDIETLLQEPTLRLYSQLIGCKPLWIARDFIPKDKPSGGFRIISYVENKHRVSLSEEWTMISEAVYGEKFIDELSEFMQKNRIQSVLECGCGSGSVLKGLAEKGFECVGIDSDIEMVARAVRNNPTSARFKLLDWLNLNKLDDQFDMVMCRGNSLSHVVSWGRESLDPEQAREAITKSIQIMLDKVKDGGMLYLDGLTQDEIDRGNSPLSFEAEGLSLGGFVEYDFNKKIRHMYGSGIVNGKPFEGGVYSYIITPQEIVNILRQSGVKEAWLQKLDNEQHYQIICAKK